MRSSKSRSRSKNNRNRSTVGNVVNRVFDSSGPESKVRGTPQQIIDKYNQLARDAQLSNDRVAAENFQQHAEHYMRMLSEATREQEQRREQQERETRDRQSQRDQRGDSQGNNDAQSNGNDQTSAQNGSRGGQDSAQQGSGQQGSGSGQSDGDQGGSGRDRRNDSRQDTRQAMSDKPRYERADDIVDLSDGGSDDSGLVDTPENPISLTTTTAPATESRPEREKTAGRQTRSKPPEAEEQPETAEKPKPKPRRKPRKKPDPAPDAQGDATPASDDTPSAAE